MDQPFKYLLNASKSRDFRFLHIHYILYILSLFS